MGRHFNRPVRHSHHHSHPRLAKPSAGPPGEDWLEVFYDLIFGVAVIELGQFLSADPGPDFWRSLLFLGFLIPIWWIWVGWTVYVARFEADDSLHRLLTFVQMLAIAVMTVQIDAGRSGSVIFAAAYVTARLSLLALFVRARRRIPAAVPIARVNLLGFGLGGAFWAVSIFVPLPGRYWLWGAGLMIEFATPWIARPVLRRLPLDATHLTNRLGAFTSIILGLAVAGVVAGVGNMLWNPGAVLAGLLGFTLAVCVWWIRAEFLGRTFRRRVVGPSQAYIYGNLPIVIGLTLMSVGVQLAIVRAAGGPPAPGAFWLLGAGAAMWLSINIVFSRIVAHQRSPLRVAAYAVAILVSLALPFVVAPLSSIGALALLTAAFVGLVLIEYLPGKRPAAGAQVVRRRSRATPRKPAGS